MDVDDMFDFEEVEDTIEVKGRAAVEAALTEVRKQFPYGHPDFNEALVRLAKLHSDKNHDYAKGGNPLGNFQRVAAMLSMYPNLRLNNPATVAITYAMKQIDAVLWSLNTYANPLSETVHSRLKDIAVYMILTGIILERGADEPEVEEDID